MQDSSVEPGIVGDFNPLHEEIYWVLERLSIFIPSLLRSQIR
ncbi:MAG TPA: hypothetical protein V6C78_11520 [Crinalium sp.]